MPLEFGCTPSSEILAAMRSVFTHSTLDHGNVPSIYRHILSKAALNKLQSLLFWTLTTKPWFTGVIL